jgi:transposase
MKAINFFVGIDVSKETLDFCLVVQGKYFSSFTSKNTVEGIKNSVEKLIKEHKIIAQETVFCLEHTGIYSYHLCAVLQELGLSIWLENPTQIKFSMGLQRGKNDKIDARRIAQYAYKNRENVKEWTPKRENIVLLTELLAVRDRLSTTLHALAVPIKEQKKYWNDKLYEEISPYSQTVVEELEKQIKAINEKIDEVIDKDKHLKELFGLITSVPGIGRITATELIVQTNEFKDFSNARKLACYIGVAPFEHSSGTSVRGRTKVSQKANKKLKTLLQLVTMNCAKVSGRMNVFKAYYQRKVTEGKSKMSVLNALKNKLLHTIFAVVKNKQKFENNWENCLVKP